MALKKILTAGSLLAALFIGQFETAEAQIHLPDARFEHRDIEQSDETMPMATPGVFDYDAQIFAPMDFVSDDQLEPRIGFYLSYDRTYLSLSKAPRIDAASTTNQIDLGSNFVWGSRYHFGWFSENETGWSVSYQRNRGNAFHNGQDILVSNPMLVTNGFASLEINRMFRQTMSSGSVLEPYLGLRYYNVHDETLEDTNQDFVIGVLPADNRFKQEATNNMVGFHAGARHTRRAGKWRFTTDGSMTAAYNQQKYLASDILREITPAGVILTSISETAVEDQSFVPAIDFEFDIAYNVTRDITLKTGVQAVYLWTGINRANTLTTGLNPNSLLSGGVGATETNDTRFLAAGFVFGFEWRR